MIRADRAAGLRPFLVVPAAGTTNTGAIDPLDDVAEIAEAEELWMHVDAAYGGFFQLTERGRERFRGIERADSITLDPHKGMFLPYGTGSLIVRDGDGAARRALRGRGVPAGSARPRASSPTCNEYSPELSRDHRGFRVWLPLKLHGVGAFREALDEKLDLTHHLHASLARGPGDRASAGSRSSRSSPFRLAGADDDDEPPVPGTDQRVARVFLSSTSIRGRYMIRACIVSHRTHRDRIDECIDIVRTAAAVTT